MSVADTQGIESRRYRLNEPSIAADIFDGEAVIMHLEHGTYYGLDRVGADVWTMVLRGRTVAEIAEAIAGHYQADRETVGADVAGLVGQMAEEELIVEADGRAGGPAEAEFHAERYAPPTLSIYRDMKNLLAFDPPLPDFKAKDFQ